MRPWLAILWALPAGAALTIGVLVAVWLLTGEPIENPRPEWVFVGIGVAFVYFMVRTQPTDDG